MSRPQKNSAAAASVAQAPSGPYTSISDVDRRMIENAGTGEALVHLDRKITDGLNLVHERIRDLSEEIKDARTESKADIAELKDMIRALDAKVEANRERDRSDHRADMAELKDMIRASTAEGAANRELVGEVRTLRRLVWMLAGIVLGIGIAAALDPAVAAAAFNAIFNAIFGG